MLSEGLGKLSFGLMLLGVLTTFLIQHVIGLDGMPGACTSTTTSATSSCTT